MVLACPRCLQCKRVGDTPLTGAPALSASTRLGRVQVLVPVGVQNYFCSLYNFKLLNFSLLASRGREPGANALSRRRGLPQCPGPTNPPATVVTPARNTTSPPARLPLLHLLKLYFKIPVVPLLVSYRKSFSVMSPSLSSTLWSCHAAKRHLLHSLVFVSLLCVRLEGRVTFMLEQYQAVIATIIRSPSASSPGTSSKRSVDAAHSKTTTLFVKMACAACLSCVGGVNLVRFCRCFFHAQRATRCQRGNLMNLWLVS